MDTITGIIVGGVLAIVAGAVPAIIQLLRARSDRAHELTRDKLQHDHEMRRDRLTRQDEFRLLEHKERREACADLLASTQQYRLSAVARFEAIQALQKPRTSETIGRVNAEASEHAKALQLAGELSQRGLRILRTDPDAQQVVHCYRSLPAKELLDDPLGTETRQAWSKGERDLQEAIFAYLRGLDSRLFGDGTTLSMAGATSSNEEG